jgi:hypothetical protein
MRTEVLANGFDPVQFGSSRVNAYINDGYQYVCAQTNYTGDEAILDFTTSAGFALYPQPTDASDIRSLRDTSRSLELQPVGLRTIDRSGNTAGAPSSYALNGANFQLWPVPNGTYPLECRYWKIPALLVADTDVPIIPPMWHWLLWTWAVAQAFRAEDDVQRAQTWDQRFQKGLSDFVASVKFTSDMPTHARSMWNPKPTLGSGPSGSGGGGGGAGSWGVPGHTIANAGTPLSTRPTLNFKGNLLAVDNSAAASTDVDVGPSVVSNSSQSSPQLFLEAFGAKGDGTTDDTAAFTSALTAANAIGAANGFACVVSGTPGKKYSLKQVTPRSYVDLRLYGCSLVIGSGAANTGIFSGNSGTVSHFSLRGGTLVGTGSEGDSQGLIFGGLFQYLVIEDWFISNMARTPMFISDSQYVWVQRNVLTTVCANSGRNAINFVNSSNGSTLPLKHLWADQNYIDNFKNIGINVVTSTTPNRVDTELDAHITNNSVFGSSTTTWCIGIEQGGSSAPPNIAGFDISGNRCVNPNTGSSPGGIVLTNDSSPASNDALCISDGTIHNNRVICNSSSTGSAIVCQASHVAITGNRCAAGASGYPVNIQNHGSAIVHHIQVSGNSGPLSTFGYIGYNTVPDSATFTASGNTRFGPETVAVPASGSAVAAPLRNRTYYVTAATGGCTMTLQDGKAIVIPAAAMGTVIVPAGQTVTPTYTNAPTWVVEGD